MKYTPLHVQREILEYSSENKYQIKNDLKQYFHLYNIRLLEIKPMILKSSSKLKGKVSFLKIVKNERIIVLVSIV